jgi:hypothetical protein
VARGRHLVFLAPLVFYGVAIRGSSIETANHCREVASHRRALPKYQKLTPLPGSAPQPAGRR